MNTKFLSKLTIGSLAAAGLLASAGIANANIVTRETDPQMQSFGPQQTDFDTTLTFDSFDENDVVLGPRETFIDFNSVHILLTGLANAGPGGSVQCFVGDNDGRCTGSVESKVTMDLSIAGISLGQVIPLTTTNYDIAQGETISLAPDSGMDSDEIVYDLMDLLPDGATAVEIQTVLDQFDESIVGPNVILDVVADGTVTTINDTGVAAGQNPITGTIEAEIVYDYKVETVMDTPEPASLLGLGFIGGLGLLGKRKKS